MDPHLEAAALSTWAAQYRQFASHDCTEDPLYVALCRAIAAEPALLGLMAEMPPTQRRPNLLLAALHERILAGVAHPLRDYYRSVGGRRAPDAELPALLLDFARQERAALLQHLRGRSTQTNEIGRCAVLWPALQHIAALSGRQDLALLDFGCSAGLNLGVDDYHYDYGGFQLGAAPAPQRAGLRSEWWGEAAAIRPRPWRIVQRLGLDPAPVDLSDAEAVRWLRACLWPQDRERARRLDLALAQARRAAHPLRAAADCVAEIEPWLDTLPAGVQPVLFNSWVLAYMDATALAALRTRVARWIRDRGLVWLSAEAPALAPRGLPLPPLAAGARPDTLWSLQWALAGELQQAPLAWSHAHGRWLQWLA